MLEGEGVLELWPTPQRARDGAECEDIPIRAGHVDLAAGRHAGSPTASVPAQPGLT